jgi:hypothetical protein
MATLPVVETTKGCYEVPDDSNTPDQKAGWRFDRSISLPALVSIAVVVFSVVAFGVRETNSVDRRLADVARETELLKINIQKIEANQVSVTASQNAQIQSLRAEQATQMTTLRTEIRQDLKDVNDKLDRLLFNGSSARQGTREWTR